MLWQERKFSKASGLWGKVQGIKNLQQMVPPVQITAVTKLPSQVVGMGDGGGLWSAGDGAGNWGWGALLWYTHILGSREFMPMGITNFLNEAQLWLTQLPSCLKKCNSFTSPSKCHCHWLGSLCAWLLSPSTQHGPGALFSDIILMRIQQSILTF